MSTIDPELLQAFREAVHAKIRRDLLREEEYARAALERVLPPLGEAIATARARGLCGKVWLFGSFAWGKPGERSDIDLLVEDCRDPDRLGALIARACGRDVHTVRSGSPTCDVAPTATTAYTMEARCPRAPPCVAGVGTDGVVVEVFPRTVPTDLGNTLRVVRTGDDIVLSWGEVPAAATYVLYRGLQKGAWPPPPLLSGLDAGTATLPDVPPPPELYLYRVAGVGCAGDEGP